MSYKRNMFNENFFEDLFDSINNSMSFECKHFFGQMLTDIVDNGNAYVYEIELPGFAKQDIKVDLKDGNLIVTADKSEEDQVINKEYVRRERPRNQCSRKYYVGDSVTKADIKARYEDGVLYITIPKKDDTKKDDDFIIID